MNIRGKRVGFALTGSFCTLGDVIPQIQRLVDEEAEVIPIVSPNVAALDTRFGKAEYWLSELERITGNAVIRTITEAEPIGPRRLLDIIVVAPCTGNTLAKIANGITDTSVTMAVKAHLRNERPVVISISTNDALGANAKNIGLLMNTQHLYFVPFGQDDPDNKCKSLLSKNILILETLEKALDGVQLQPIIGG